MLVFFRHAVTACSALRLRAGDVSVLTEYAEHGRIRGGTSEEATEQAYRGWLADYLAGLDSVLIARTQEQVRELSRRARDDLIRYGRVAAGPQVRLAAGEHVGVGGLVTARRNDHSISAGRNGRGLVNRDVMRITAMVTDAGQTCSRVEVRRLMDRDPDSGQAVWSAPFLLPRRYLAHHATLAYATTAHAALGRTTDTAHVLVDGQEDKQGLYVAMSRGRIANYAYCITHSARLADIAEGSCHAPELDRARRLDRERAGLQAGASSAVGAGSGEAGPVLDPVTVLAGTMSRDGGDLSATETLEQHLAEADHLGVLGGIWDDLVRGEQRARFEQALCAVLPADLAGEALSDSALTWLWRTLREAESAGLDGSLVMQRAVAARNMTGVRDVARVLDARVRQTLAGVRPQPPGRRAERVPSGGSAEIRRYLCELAEAMDDRGRRLGEHAALTQPLWARQALGPVSRDPAARLDWEHRASVIAAYRERYGHSHPADPIGPEPAKTSPEARAAWHGALAATGRIDGIDLRHCTDGELWLRRGTYERETAWAPPHVSRELQLVHAAGRDAHVNAFRAEFEARVTRDRQAAARHRELASRWRTVEAKAAAEAQLLTEVQDTRRQWEKITQSTRRIAIAADIELRRRHPRRPITVLHTHPAEAAAMIWPQQPDATGPSPHDTHGTSSVSRSVRRRRQRRQTAPVVPPENSRLTALGLTFETADAEVPPELLRMWRNGQATQSQLEDLGSLRLPAEEHDYVSPGLAWPDQTRRERSAILQQPQLEIAPSARLLEPAEEIKIDVGHAEAEREAG